MNTNKFTAFCAQMPTRFLAAPAELKFFFIFTFLVTILDITLHTFGSKDLKASIVPITGWSSSLNYPYCLMFVSFLIFNVRHRNFLWIRNTIIIFMILNIVFGAFALLTSGGDFYNKNPYLSISPWQPVWRMVIPAIWLLVLFSPGIKKYCLWLNEIQ